MNFYRFTTFIIGLFCLSHSAFAQSVKKPAASFEVVPLGVRGGLDESNLSSYMVAPAGASEYICLDAGTVFAGIQKAIDAGTFHTTAADVLRHYIKGYCISHPHLDHVAGLIINSPEDTAKNIYGLPYTLKVLRDKYFSWESWANFGDAGEKPQLKKYHYDSLMAGEERSVPGTTMTIKAFPLSHGEPYQSTAFLVKAADDWLLYLGDTGADTVEHAGRLHHLWEEVAPYVKNGRLKAIFIETSFPDEQPLKSLFGHLTPKLLMGEMDALRRLSGLPSLAGLTVVITHRKPTGDQEGRIKQQLESENNLGFNLLFPRQGERIVF